ncbi:MAG: NIPSNAP family protein [Chromatiales bacterium]|nr:NIPSNAP family protein [Chromatiales bacterium]
MRTYDLAPGSLPEAVKRFGEGFEHRKAFSPLAAFWFTEIGPLNQIVHIWAHESLDQRAAVRDQAKADGVWPPKGSGGRYGLSSDNSSSAIFARRLVRAITSH